MIEKVSGQSYYDYVQRAHLRARGDDPDRIAARRPSGSRPGNRIQRATRDDRLGPEHRHAALPRNLGGRRLHDGRGPRPVRARAVDHKLLSPAATKLLITGKVRAPPLGVRYAYGFEDARAADGSGWVGHAGGAPGMSGDLRIYPKSGYVVAVLANIDPPAAQRISDYLDPRLRTER